MKNQIRAFIAVPLSPSVRAEVARLIRLLQSRMEGAKWVDPQDLHVTLKFLGDIPINDLHRLIPALARAAEQIEPFDLEFQGCGAFPDTTSPRTIWVGCKGGSAELIRLVGAVDEELFRLGFPKETRRFSPHLTVGRVKKTDRDSITDLGDFFHSQQSRSFGSCDVDEMILYSSELTRRGPIYDDLAVVPLR